MKRKKTISGKILNSRDQIVFPRDVYHNGEMVGTQDARGVITFTTYETGVKITDMIQNKTYGIIDTDTAGNITSYVTISLISDTVSRKNQEIKYKGAIL